MNYVGVHLPTIDLFPGKMLMMIHKPIDTAGYTDANIDELMDLTHRVFETCVVSDVANESTKDLHLQPKSFV